jgi:uncharacterized membrane protein SirB2
VIEFAGWLAATPLNLLIQETTWLTPLLQSIHIVMIAVVFVSILMIVLRILGRMRTDETFEQVWARFAPWMWIGVVIMALTGIVLTIGEPVREFTSFSFWLKMALIVVGLSTVAYFHRALAGHTGNEFPQGIKRAAIAMIAVWVFIIFLGRAIAYDVAVWGTLSFAA